jgi:hypothetical protein
MTLYLDLRCGRSSLENPFFEFIDFLIIPLFVFNGNLFKWKFLILRKERPSVANRLHDLSYCEEGELASDYLSELLTEVDVSRERLLRLVFNDLILKVLLRVLGKSLLTATIIGRLDLLFCLQSLGGR